jgi:hypothetical protein
VTTAHRASSLHQRTHQLRSDWKLCRLEAVRTHQLSMVDPLHLCEPSLDCPSLPKMIAGNDGILQREFIENNNREHGILYSLCYPVHRRIRF